jgi:hypothetical protein
MPSLVPLNNAIAQNSVDFNNQTPTNASGLFRYKVNQYGTNTHTFSSSDLNAVCVFSGDVNVLLSSSNFAQLPPVGAEIVFYSTSGRVRLDTSGVSLYVSIGNFTLGPNSIGKIIYKGNNEWFFASSNFTAIGDSFPNCCANTEYLYQLRLPTDSVLNLNRRAYVDSTTLDKPFNGIVSYAGAYYSVVNGYFSATAGCSTKDYTTSYTFYSNASTPVTFYSVTGLSPNIYTTLSGSKFFTSSVAAEYDCYSIDMVAPGSAVTYYGSTAQYPGSPLVFLHGYVVNIDSYL